MTEKHEADGNARLKQYRGVLVSLGIVAAIYTAAYLSSPDPQWSFSTKTVVVEKTITEAPWWFNATGPAFIVLMVGVIIYGVSGGFPRP